MKNLSSNLKEKLVSKYLKKDQKNIGVKSTDINVLLNRVKTNQKNESKKKNVFFSICVRWFTSFWTINFLKIQKSVEGNTSRTIKNHTY